MFHVVREKQTYLNLLYLFLAFPLGIFYFVLLITGISLGISTAIIWIGLPILLLTVVIWRGFAAFERALVRHWLHVPISFISPPAMAGVSWWKRLTTHLSTPTTWTGLVYLFLEFPFGILSFTLVVTLLSLSLGLTFIWLAYLIDTLIYNAVGGGYTSYDLFVKVTGQIEPGAMALLLFIGILGFLVLVASLHILNGIAYAWGQFARLMLGMSSTATQLAEARAQVAREHAKAERSDQSRRELIVNVSHELRTPIASIRGHVESLLMVTEGGATAVPTPAEQHAYLDIVQREAERLGMLVDDLLALARAEADELRLDVMPVHAGEVIEEVYQSLAPLARRERQITVVRDIPPDLPPVLADRQRLVQVLLNLVRNAIAYTPVGGIVSIMLERADATHLSITVADTGIGIAPEDLERIFERFYRTDASRARSTGGFGLGLAIVRDLVNAMGGTISAESTVGEGSRFRLLLPLASSAS
jgi:two-component system phosphate regulon sensor histidine kinase PhoR